MSLLKHLLPRHLAPRAEPPRHWLVGCLLSWAPTTLPHVALSSMTVGSSRNLVWQLGNDVQTWNSLHTHHSDRLAKDSRNFRTPQAVSRESVCLLYQLFTRPIHGLRAGFVVAQPCLVDLA